MGFVIVEFVHKGTRWNPREVPFEIKNGDFPPGSVERGEVELAIEQWNQQAPHIPFIARTAQPNFVVFVTHDESCRSPVGRRGGRQEVRCNLADPNFGFGNVMHEMAHAVGIDHEHQRPDRKKFITIHTENIKEEILDQFDIVNDGSLEVVNVYDYDSITHYGVGSPSQFDVLRLNEQPGAIVGQRDHLSAGDIKSTLYLYGFSVTRTVDFGVTAVGEHKVREVSVQNHLARSLSIRGGTVSPAFFPAGGFPATVGPFGTVSGTVEFIPTTEGVVKATLSLTVDDVNVSVRIFGRGDENIEPP